jgi:hypothetical protein
VLEVRLAVLDAELPHATGLDDRVTEGELYLALGRVRLHASNSTAGGDGSTSG